MQGGIHPSFTGQSYLDLLAAAKAGAPGIHVHAFSPLEVNGLFCLRPTSPPRRWNGMQRVIHYLTRGGRLESDPIYNS